MTPVLVPLRDRSGKTVATALLDPDDRDLGTLVWYRNSNGYAIRHAVKPGAKIRRNASGKTWRPRRTVYLHVEVACRAITPRRGDVIDHRNGDKLDCRRGNLRAQERGENSKPNLPARRTCNVCGKAKPGATECRFCSTVTCAECHDKHPCESD